jgi:hypothetical protein
MVFSDIMDEGRSIVQAEEAAVAAASLSTRRLKRHRRHVNYDREAAHFRLRHDNFDDDCTYPRHTSIGGIVCG